MPVGSGLATPALDHGSCHCELLSWLSFRNPDFIFVLHIVFNFKISSLFLCYCLFLMISSAFLYIFWKFILIFFWNFFFCFCFVSKSHLYFCVFVFFVFPPKFLCLLSFFDDCIKFLFFFKIQFWKMTLAEWNEHFAVFYSEHKNAISNLEKKWIFFL